MRIDTERFEIERVVGSGSMGTVFRARDRESGVPVAMKVMRSETPARAARFEREAEVLELLEHDSIVRYIGHGVTRAGERFLVMEWLDGEHLKLRLGRAGLTLAETVAAGRRVAEGLAVAHRAGIVHRDIKPTNLVLVDGLVERIKLIDFGVAAYRRPSLGAEDTELTGTGDVIGTPAYMAPEQAHGRRVGPPADVFALGCVLYECLAGRAPFVHSRTASVLSALASTATAPRLRLLRPELPAPVADLVERMISRSPGMRPQDGDALVTTLRAIPDELLAGVPAPPRARRAHHAESTTVQAVAAEGSTGGFSSLRRAHESAPALSPISSQTLAILSRHVPMPMAVLRAQCERLGQDPQELGRDDLAKVAPALAEAVGRFTQPAIRALVLDELRALAEEKD